MISDDFETFIDDNFWRGRTKTKILVQKVIHFIKIQNNHSKEIFIFLKVQNIHSKQIFIFFKNPEYSFKASVHFFKIQNIYSKKYQFFWNPEYSCKKIFIFSKEAVSARANLHTGNIFEQVINNMLGGGDCVLCLEFVIVWCARYINLVLAGAELFTQMCNYPATFRTMCRRFSSFSNYQGIWICSRCVIHQCFIFQRKKLFLNLWVDDRYFISLFCLWGLDKPGLRS